MLAKIIYEDINFILNNEYMKPMYFYDLTLNFNISYLVYWFSLFLTLNVVINLIFNFKVVLIAIQHKCRWTIMCLLSLINYIYLLELLWELIIDVFDVFDVC